MPDVSSCIFLVDESINRVSGFEKFKDLAFNGDLLYYRGMSNRFVKQVRYHPRDFDSGSFCDRGQRVLIRSWRIGIDSVINHRSELGPFGGLVDDIYPVLELT